MPPPYRIPSTVVLPEFRFVVLSGTREAAATAVTLEGTELLEWRLDLEGFQQKFLVIIFRNESPHHKRYWIIVYY